MTYEKINNLPTILEILDQIASEEESLRNNVRWSFLSNLGAEDKFEVFSESPDKPSALRPTTSCFNSYFRGQSCYYEKCFPTLYRNKEKDFVDLFIDRLRISEFELLIQKHPIVKTLYEKGIKLKNLGEDRSIKIKVDSLGLAQHYELETDLIDFTSDKWVAAFFATCIKKKGMYFPVDESKDKLSYGVYYRFTLSPLEITNTKDNQKFSIIGLQPFKRPGEQKGFALQLEDGENLNDFKGIEKYFFRHDNLTAEIIYNRMNQGKDLFPYDELETLASKIKYSKKISTFAFDLTFEKYPRMSMPKEMVRDSCILKGIKFVNYPVASFSKGKVKNSLNYWEKIGEREYYSKIVTRSIL